MARVNDFVPLHTLPRGGAAGASQGASGGCSLADGARGRFLCRRVGDARAAKGYEKVRRRRWSGAEAAVYRAPHPLRKGFMLFAPG